MKIAVLNGSPKGEISVTMQYVKYMQKHLSEHEFEILNISHNIKNIERESVYFTEIIEKVKTSDAVLWAFPVYYLLVPSQYKRFIELVFERGAQPVFKDKYAAVLTTSIHYFDSVAANYMNAICDDLDMRYVGEFLAAMSDLEKSTERERLLKFANYFLYAIKNQFPAVRNHAPIVYEPLRYKPRNVTAGEKTDERKIVVLTDEAGTESNLGRMINVFAEQAPWRVEVVNICDINMKGGCRGCINCGYDGTCVYKDGYKEFYETRILSADAIVLAGTIKDRYLSSRWKMFFDRSFYRGHTPFFMGKLQGAIISGPLRQNQNLRQLLEVFLQSYKNNSVGIVTDEYESEEEITAQLRVLVETLDWSLANSFEKPMTFYGLSSRLIFRDFVYLAKGIFRNDNIFYRRHKLYDFPQTKVKARATSLYLGALCSIRPIRAQIQKDMKHHMISGLQKIVETS